MNSLLEQTLALVAILIPSYKAIAVIHRTEEIRMIDSRKQRLIELGCVFHENQYKLPPKARIERHVKLFAGIAESSTASIGAFTYSWSNIVESIRSIGRYCSIAHSAGFGEFEHPTDRFTTSAFTFDSGMFEEATADTGFKIQPFSGNSRFFQKIDIGNDVWIGAGSYIRTGVNLGTGCIIGSRAVVTKDVPPYAVVVGNPGKIVKYRFNEIVIDKLLKSEWWKYKFTDFEDVDFSDINRFIDLINSGKIMEYEQKFF